MYDFKLNINTYRKVQSTKIILVHPKCEIIFHFYNIAKAILNFSLLLPVKLLHSIYLVHFGHKFFASFIVCSVSIEF